MKIFDVLGQTLEVGDYILYSCRYSNTSLTVGKIEGFTPTGMVKIGKRDRIESSTTDILKITKEQYDSYGCKKYKNAIEPTKSKTKISI